MRPHCGDLDVDTHYSANLYALAWLLVPICLYLHLQVPRSLCERHRRHLMPPLYVLAAVLALLEFVRVLPHATYDPEEVIAAFSTHITSARSLEALATTLADEAASSLLIRQSVLLALAGRRCSAVYLRGVRPDEVPETFQVEPLLATAGHYRPPVAGQGPLEWVRLAVALKASEKTVGLWLLGRRNPDEY